MQQGRASIAFHFDRGDPGSAFAHRYLGHVAQAVFVASGHPLAALAEVTRSDLARYRQLVMQMEGVEEVVLSPTVWRTDSFYSIAGMVADELGWAILPLNIAEYESFRRTLTRVPCTGLSLPMLSVRTLWLQGASLSTTELWLQQRMGQMLGGTTAG
ncbi:LysR substrate binding domain protein [compost metagenome]